ncbi:hypothetical protein MW887_010702 [Aspergillus wentii]|nr:hypothetical protein MW887_010702 [Aspergillus wentii]
MSPSLDTIIPRYLDIVFQDALAFQSHLIHQVSEARASGNDVITDFFYTNIDSSWAVDTIKLLEQKRLVCFKSYRPSWRIFKIRTVPTPLHHADQEWLSLSRDQWLPTGVLTQNERSMLTTTSNTLFRFSSGPYAQMTKAPNIAVQLNATGLPRVVFESGFSQSFDNLRADVGEWMIGGTGAVQAVVVVKWKPSRAIMRVRGDVKLYTLQSDGMPRLVQTEQIFPKPPGPPQILRLTRGMFFGANIDANRSANDVFGLEIDELRPVATRLMANMGYTPV